LLLLSLPLLFFISLDHLRGLVFGVAHVLFLVLVRLTLRGGGFVVFLNIIILSDHFDLVSILLVDICDEKTVLLFGSFLLRPLLFFCDFSEFGLVFKDSFVVFNC